MKIKRIKNKLNNPFLSKVGASQKRNPQKVINIVKVKNTLQDFSMEHTYILRNYIKIIKRLCSIFFPTSYRPDDFYHIYHFYNKMIKNHGIVGTIKYMKNLRLICTRYICGKPILINN